MAQPAPADSGETASHSLLLRAPLSTFIGREQEIESIADLLQQDRVRLVTLTGPGGVGKTRLALQIAKRVAPSFRDGVVSVSLASVRDPGLVLGTIVQTLGIRDVPNQSAAQQLEIALRGRDALLLLDNFEHVLDAGPDIAELLAACPGLRVLVTSRSVLHLSGEHDVAVSPLLLSAEGAPVTLALAVASSAVQLFVQRAQAASSGFSLSGSNAAAVMAICRRVDGLPLAIEMAAARTAHLPVSALLERLEHRLPLLTGGARDQPARQQTMRNTIAWSYDLLTPGEQSLFRRLAVFDGGFTLDAAKAVSAPVAVDSLDGIAALVDTSLIKPVDVGTPEPRYLMLETLREFGIDQLAEQGEIDSVRAVHAEYFTHFAEEIVPRISGPSPASEIAALGRDRDNIRAALRWYDEQREEPGQLLRLTAALGLLWEMDGPWREGQAWLEKVVVRDPEPSAALAEVLITLGGSASSLGELDQAEQWFRDAIDVARQAGATNSLDEALQGLGAVLVDQRRYVDGEAALRQAVAVAQEAADGNMIALSLVHLGVALWGQGKTDEARSSLEAGRVKGLDAGYGIPTAVGSRYLGFLALEAGDMRLAAERFRAFWNWNPVAPHLLARLVADLVVLAAARDQFETAATLAGALDTLRQTTGSRPAWPECGVHEQAIAQATEFLGERRFQEAAETGRVLSADLVIELVEYVLGAAEGASEEIRGRETSALLTPREQQVLVLIVAGCSNTEIGDRLFISTRTAQTHVTHILAKLDVATRTEAATKAVRDGLV